MQRRAEQSLDILRRHDAALTLSGVSTALAGQTVDALRRTQTCEPVPGAEGSNPWAALRTGLTQFLDGFNQWLRHGSDAEIHLNLCRFWGEQIAPAFEWSLAEGAFLSAALENAVADALGAARHRAHAALRHAGAAGLRGRVPPAVSRTGGGGWPPGGPPAL